MKLNTKHFTFALTSFVSVVYVICAIFVMILPRGTVGFFNLLFHGIDLTKIMKTVNLLDVLLGLIITIVVTLALSALFACIWNTSHDKWR